MDTTDKVKSPLLSCLIKICVCVFGSFLLVATTLFWIYGTDTTHASRNSIWWNARCRNLIPPTAKNITIQQDFLDHYATYTVSEKSLTDFLNTHFDVTDSYSERRPVDASEIGKPIGRLGWVVTEDTVEYGYSARNGGRHRYFHDASSGQTYQESAYW